MAKKQPNRTDGRFEAKVTMNIDGKTTRKSFYSRKSKEDALKQAEAYKIKLGIAEATGQGIIRQNVLFKTWAEKWLEIYIKGKVKDNTYRGTYENPVNVHLIPFFGEYYLNEITPSTVQMFFDIKQKSYAYETIKKMRSCLRNIMETAIDEGYCIKSPMTRKVRITEVNNIPTRRTYTQPQYDILLEYAKQHPNGISLVILLETGMSRSELLGLRYRDIDNKENTINIKNATIDVKETKSDKYVVLTEGLKNKFRERIIPVKPFVIEMISELPRKISVGGNIKKNIPPKYVTTQFVVSSPTGLSYSPNNWYKRVYKPFMENFSKAYPDIPILNPHELRHTRATLWKDSGVDMYSIAKLLGHSDLDMLIKRYAHSSVESLKKALNLTTL